MDLLAYLLAKKAAGGDAAAAEAAAKAYTDATQDAELFDRKISFGLLLNYVRQHNIDAEHGTVTLTNSLAFPFNNSKTTVNLGLEWRHRESSPTKLITENYFNITLGVNFNELWFWKSRIR